jgi:hypothetical protein
MRDRVLGAVVRNSILYLAQEVATPNNTTLEEVLKLSRTRMKKNCSAYGPDAEQGVFHSPFEPCAWVVYISTESVRRSNWF